MGGDAEPGGCDSYAGLDDGDADSDRFRELLNTDFASTLLGRVNRGWSVVSPAGGHGAAAQIGTAGELLDGRASEIFRGRDFCGQIGEPDYVCVRAGAGVLVLV